MPQTRQTPPGEWPLNATDSAVTQLLSRLNADTAYIVLDMPAFYPSDYPRKSAPLELLVEDAAKTAKILGARRVANISRKPLYRVDRVSAEKDGLELLLRTPADGFVCAKWAKELLAGRSLTDSGVYVPTLADFFYVFAYRLVAHRFRIHQHDIYFLNDLLARMQPQASESDHAAVLDRVFAFMREKGFAFVSPTDRSIRRNPGIGRVVEGIDQVRNEPGITNPRLLSANMPSWPGILFFRAEYNGVPCFIKYFTAADSFPEWEATWTKRLHEISPANFPEVLFYRQSANYNCIAMRLIQGTGLRKALDSGQISRSSVFSQLLTIASALRQAKCMHRDICIGNFMVSGEQLILIDFEYAVGWSPYREHPTCLKYPYRIRELGKETGLAAFTWDDMAEMQLLAETIGSDEAAKENRDKLLHFLKENKGRPVLVFPQRRLTIATMFARKIFCSLLPVKAWRWQCRKW